MGMLYYKRWGLFYLPVLVLFALAIFIAARYAFPLPPRHLVIAAGVAGGGYARMAERYRDELEQRGIAVDIALSSNGASGPLQRLGDAGDPAEMGFAHGLLSDGGSAAAVHALAVIGKQPVWAFTHHSHLSTLGGGVRGLKIAAGPRSSAARGVAAMLLGQAKVNENEVNWDDAHQGLAAANELLEHRVDLMIHIGSSDSPTARLLARSSGIYMMGIERANALAAREPRLHPFVLPQGTIELRGDVPARDLTLLYTGTNLLVRKTMHPALQRALLDAAFEIHATPSLLQLQSEYPDFQADFPLSPVAQRYAAGQRPWTELALPYWWAQLAELVFYAVLPLALLTAAALMWIPQFFSLRVSAMLAQYYGELKFIEHDIEDLATDSPITLRSLLSRLDELEQDVSSLDLPDRYADRWYTLREHLGAAQERLLKLRGR